MDKFAEISRSTTNVNSKAAKDLLFKTLDPKSSQAAQTIVGEITATNKASTGGQPKGDGAGTTKLPPIQRRPTLKKDSAAGSQQ
jgi:hypothetical protein